VAVTRENAVALLNPEPAAVTWTGAEPLGNAVWETEEMPSMAIAPAAVADRLPWEITSVWAPNVTLDGIVPNGICTLSWVVVMEGAEVLLNTAGSGPVPESLICNGSVLKGSNIRSRVTIVRVGLVPRAAIAGVIDKIVGAPRPTVASVLVMADPAAGVNEAVHVDPKAAALLTESW
jgi:hypothetical protein